MLVSSFALYQVITRLPWFRRQKKRKVENEIIHFPTISTPLLMVINMKSGSKLGMEIARTMMEIPSEYNPPDIFYLNHKDASGNNNGDALHSLFEKLAHYYSIFLLSSNKNLLPRLIIAGGDGTIRSVIQELFNPNNLELCTIASFIPISIVPLGTGNDQARSLGFKHLPFTLSNVDSVLEWLNIVRTGQVVFNDIFDVVIDVDESVTFIQNKELVSVKEIPPLISLCYVGLGLSAQVSFYVELHRQSFAMLNKFMYFLFGIYVLLTSLLKSSIPVSKLIEKFELEERGSVKKIIHKEQVPTFQSIVCLNIPSYGGGSNIWQFTRPVSEKSLTAQQTQQERFTCSTPLSQKRDDGGFELLAMNSLLQEAAVVGPKVGFLGGIIRLAHAVAQLTVGFVKGNKETIFIQVDGESFQIQGIKSLKISPRGRQVGFVSNVIA
jgi:Diacylglycerol kinase accessory domain/Diacylglycerol kinase catalytic domain